MEEKTELQIKRISKAEFDSLHESYPSLTLEFVEQKVRDVLAGKVEGVIAMFIKHSLVVAEEEEKEEEED